MSSPAKIGDSEQMRPWIVPQIGSQGDRHAEPAIHRPTAEDTASALRQLAEIADAREAARQEGFAQGLREGRDAAAQVAAQELATMRERFHALTCSLGTNLRSAEDQISKEILALSLELAQSMIRASIAVKPDLVLGIVSACLEEMPGIRDLEIRAHPDDVSLIQAEFSGRPAGAPPVCADPSLERGECYVTSASTVLDGRHRVRWAELLRDLADQHAWQPNG